MLPEDLLSTVFEDTTDVCDMADATQQSRHHLGNPPRVNCVNFFASQIVFISNGNALASKLAEVAWSRLAEVE
jgi:hypothetical protein